MSPMIERLIDSPIPVPSAFGGEEGVEDTMDVFRIKSLPGILNLDQYFLCVLGRRNQQASLAGL